MSSGSAAIIGAVIAGAIAAIGWFVNHWLNERKAKGAESRQDDREAVARRRATLNEVSQRVSDLEGAGATFREAVRRSSPTDGNPTDELSEARTALVRARSNLETAANRLSEEMLRASAQRFVEADEVAARALFDHRGGYEPKGTELDDLWAAYEQVNDDLRGAYDDLDN
jgi:hypothetical protein